jgi:outer membrane protein TolC
LDTVLRLAEVQNGQVSLAREKVREAYADQNLAKTAWLPAIMIGPTYYRHEGGVQNQDGTLQHSSTGALFGGLDLYGRFDLREALFRQIQAERQIWQQKGELSRITSETLLEATTTYIDLLAARTGETIARQLLTYEEGILAKARARVQPEPGTRFQLKSIEAEVFGVQQAIARLNQQGNSAALKLAYLLGLGPGVELVAVDSRLVPFDLVDPSTPCEELVNRALSGGPGVRELDQLLVAVLAGREKAKGPGRFAPVLEVGMWEGVFGAGPGSRADWDNRWDLGLRARWNLTDLVTGPRLECVANSRLHQLHLTREDLRSRLALGVQEAREASLSGRKELGLAEEATKKAQEGYELSNKRLQENIPGSTTTEVMEFIRALQLAQISYVNTIGNYDKAQLRLMVLTGGAFPSKPVCQP